MKTITKETTVKMRTIIEELVYEQIDENRKDILKKQGRKYDSQLWHIARNLKYKYENIDPNTIVEVLVDVVTNLGITWDNFTDLFGNNPIEDESEACEIFVDTWEQVIVLPDILAQVAPIAFEKANNLNDEQTEFLFASSPTRRNKINKTIRLFIFLYLQKSTKLSQLNGGKISDYFTKQLGLKVKMDKVYSCIKSMAKDELIRCVSDYSVGSKSRSYKWVATIPDGLFDNLYEKQSCKTLVPV